MFVVVAIVGLIRYPNKETRFFFSFFFCENEASDRGCRLPLVSTQHPVLVLQTRQPASEAKLARD